MAQRGKATYPTYPRSSSGLTLEQEWVTTMLIQPLQGRLAHLPKLVEGSWPSSQERLSAGYMLR